LKTVNKRFAESTGIGDRRKFRKRAGCFRQSPSIIGLI